jgi:hypothetical protein
VSAAAQVAQARDGLPALAGGDAKAKALVSHVGSADALPAVQADPARNQGGRPNTSWILGETMLPSREGAIEVSTKAMAYAAIIVGKVKIYPTWDATLSHAINTVKQARFRRNHPTNQAALDLAAVPALIRAIETKAARRPAP